MARRVLARSGMLTLSAASALSGLSTQMLSRRRRANRVLALPLLGARVPNYRYPAFQFEADVHEVMPQFLDLFGRGRSWQLFDLLTRPDPLLEGRIPLELLRCGKKSDVLRVAMLAAMLEQGAS